jgi:sulfur carrier protein
VSASPAGPAGRTIEIRVNGETMRVTTALDVAGLLAQMGMRGRCAVEMNGEIVPRSAHADRVLRAGDVIEVVRAIGGG